MSNDSKYERLYPERAVAPLRKLAERWLTWASRMDAKGAAELSGVLNDLETLGFPADEPLFLLRGQDVLAADAVRFYAELVMETGNEALDADALIAFADRMRRWTPRKLPD